jgi:hypothetical protein
MGFGFGVFGGGHRSAYSLSFGAPFAYGYGYPGEYWRYRYQATPLALGPPPLLTKQAGASRPFSCRTTSA